MAKVPRRKPKYLADKLKQIRDSLGLSQGEMLRALGLEQETYRSAVSGYELGKREPSLLTILQYAKLAGVCADVLIDDEQKLPEKLPSKPQHK